MRKKFELKSFEQTGGLFEWQFIGNVETDKPEYQKELQKLQEEAVKKGATNGFIPREKAVELARKFQPYDPTNPGRKFHFARDIRISLLDLMINKGLINESEEDQDRVKFYTAVNTPLDKFHGIDAFIEFEDKNGKKYTITFDLTLNSQKQAYKSDIVVSELPDPNLEEEKIKYLATIEQYAQKAMGAIEIKKSHEENKEQNHPRD